MKRIGLTKRIRKTIRGSSPGLTLVEIVIAMALIAIIGVALLGGLSNAIFSLHIADVKTTAESLARSEMERVKSDSNYQDAPWEYTDADPPGYDGYTVTVIAGLVGGNATDSGLQEITVTVTHDERGEVVTLVGYKGKRNV